MSQKSQAKNVRQKQLYFHVSAICFVTRCQVARILNETMAIHLRKQRHIHWLVESSRALWTWRRESIKKENKKYAKNKCFLLGIAQITPPHSNLGKLINFFWTSRNSISTEIICWKWKIVTKKINSFQLPFNVNKEQPKKNSLKSKLLAILKKKALFFYQEVTCGWKKGHYIFRWARIS